MSGVGKVAVVTGAGSGLGKGTAVALFADGWNVVFAGRRTDRLDQAIAAANAAHAASPKGGSSGKPRALAVQTDVTQPESVRALFARTRETFGRIDVLFNNAGIGAQAMPIDELPFEVWKTVVDTNLTGMFLCMQEAVRLMKSQSPRGGRIINNGSISAHSPRVNSIAYTATKHAVTGLTKSMALDGRDFDIACGQIDIGNAESEIGANFVVPAANKTSAPMMSAALVGQAVLQMANLPLDANVLFTTLLSTRMPFIGRG